MLKLHLYGKRSKLLQGEQTLCRYHGVQGLTVNGERDMSPTVMRIGSFRFFFNSNEESRMHVHVQSPEGVAKFWLEPIIAHAESYNLNQRALRDLQRLVEENADDFRTAWKKHLG